MLWTGAEEGGCAGQPPNRYGPNVVSIVQADSTQDTGDAEVASFVVEAARGDHQSFTRLYDLFAQRVYNMILRSVRDPGAAEDVAQEVWTKVHRELRTLREPRCFPAWLYRIAAKKCIDASRHRARRPQTAPLIDDVTAVNTSPEDSVIAHEDAARIWAALAGLTPNQHMALYLREVEQRTYREIAYVLRMSETAVGLCIFRARRSLLSSYDRLQAAPLDACKSTHRVMSLSIDGRATPVQQHALELHIDRCSPCRTEFSAVRTAAHAYAGLALAPLPFVLSEHMLGAATAAKATAAGSFGKLVAWLAPNVKVVVVAGSIAATAGLTTIVAAPQAAQLVRDDTNNMPAESQPIAGAIDSTAPDDRAADGVGGSPAIHGSPAADADALRSRRVPARRARHPGISR